MNNKLGKKNVAIILILGSLGQLAWLLENSWFNTYTYDCVTTNTTPIALMNAFSAITATLTTFLMGGLSDRKGKRKPFIKYGYALWGIFTAGFIISGNIKNTFFAAFSVVLLDCIMTFFGSTAYDACYNAWLTDISNETNRGRVSVLGQLGTYISAAIGILAGSIVDKFGYPAFFISIGALVTCLGFIVSSFIEEGDRVVISQSEDKKGFIKEIISSFSKESIKENYELFLVLFTVVAIMISFQIPYAYETIFANNHIGISKSLNSALMAPIMPVAIIAAVLAGRATDNGRGKRMLLIAPIIFSIGAFIHCFANNAIILAVGRVILYAGMMLITITATAMFKNLSPEDSRGHFEGIRMVFQVLLPMVIGPSLGSFLIENFGLGPIIYLVAGIFSLIALLPAYLLYKHQS